MECINRNEPAMQAASEEIGNSNSDGSEVTQEDPLARQIRGVQTRARHYWGTRRPTPSSRFRRFLLRNHRREGSSEEDPQEAPCMRAPSTPTSYNMMKPQQLVHYIWNQSSQLDNANERELGASPPPTPATTATGLSLVSTQLPPTPVSRGFWSTVQEDTPYQGVHAAAVVKNTFIEIEATGNTDYQDAVGSRSARSLSPSHWKADTLASFSTSYWHR